MLFLGLRVVNPTYQIWVLVFLPAWAAWGPYTLILDYNVPTGANSLTCGRRRVGSPGLPLLAPVGWVRSAAVAFRGGGSGLV